MSVTYLSFLMLRRPQEGHPSFDRKLGHRRCQAAARRVCKHCAGYNVGVRFTNLQAICTNSDVEDPLQSKAASQYHEYLTYQRHVAESCSQGKVDVTITVVTGAGAENCFTLFPGHRHSGQSGPFSRQNLQAAVGVAERILRGI